MKKQRKPKAATLVTLQLWTYSGARKLVPYLRSLVQSLRDGWLELRQAEEQVRRIEARPGRADRDSLIRLEDARRDIARADARIREVLAEMHALSVYNLDPAGGYAFVPFVQGDDLAWFIFDLFDPRGLVGWRMHTDPPSSQRPLTELPASETAGEFAEGSAETPLAGNDSLPPPGASG
jgi:hypothetical protein